MSAVGLDGLVTFADGSTVTLPPGIACIVVGKDADGNPVAQWEDLTWALTPCCHASGKGSVAGGFPAVVCRSCYREVDPYFGGDATVAVAVAS